MIQFQYQWSYMAGGGEIIRIVPKYCFFTNITEVIISVEKIV